MKEKRVGALEREKKPKCKSEQHKKRIRKKHSKLNLKKKIVNEKATKEATSCKGGIDRIV